MEEWKTLHYRFLKRLVKKGLIDLKKDDWNGIAYDALLKKEKQWNEAGCFLGFYMFVHSLGDDYYLAFHFACESLNCYANAVFSNFVPEGGMRYLPPECQLVWQRFGQETRDLGKATPEVEAELIGRLGGTKLHRFHHGTAGRGSKKVPAGFAKNVVKTLTNMSRTVGKKK